LVKFINQNIDKGSTMSLLQGMIEPKDATGDIKKIYDMMEERYGFVPNAIKMQSINPNTMKLLAQLSKYFAEETGFSEGFRFVANEIIAQNDECAYCISMMKGAIVNKLRLSLDQLDAIIQDPSLAPLDNKERALLVFVKKISKDSNSTTKEDIKSLHDAGATDLEIFDAINYTTQMIKIHTMLNALKIDLD
jgi:uncharacterized peroxidase-related enzyme